MRTESRGTHSSHLVLQSVSRKGKKGLVVKLEEAVKGRAPTDEVDVEFVASLVLPHVDHLAETPLLLRVEHVRVVACHREPQSDQAEQHRIYPA